MKPSKRNFLLRISSTLSLAFLALAVTGTPAMGTPVGGGKNEKLHGGIEIGAKGVKATAINFNRKGGGYDVKILYSETINTTIMKVKENKFTPEAINETVQAVQKMYAKMQQDLQIAPERIYIVGSSGLRAENKQELVSEVQKATGKTMTFLTVEMEVQLSILGTIPQQRDDDNRLVNERHAAMLIDIGSGNTKGGYQQATPAPATGIPVDEFVTMGIPFGTVTFTNEASRFHKDDAEIRAFAVDAVTLSPMLNEQLKKEVAKKPGLVMRERLYMTGGIVWAMTTLLHPENRRSFVPLTVEDINRFQYLARTDVNSLLNPDLSFIGDEARRQEAKKEIDAVKATFTPKNIIAGAEILGAVSTEFKLKEMKIWFARYGNLSWILSYVRGQAEKQLLTAERSATSASK